MKTTHASAAVIAAAMLAGCGSAANAPDLTTRTAQTKSHSVAFFVRSDTGEIVGPEARSRTAQDGTIVTTLANGLATSVDVSVNGSIGGNTQVPGADNLKVDASNPNFFRQGDTFLSRVQSGGSYTLNHYRTFRDGRRFDTYISGGTRTGNMPRNETASYTGQATATVYSTATGVAEVTGNAALTGSFSSNGGSVSGRITNLNGPMAGTDIRLNASSLNGSSFQGGSLDLVDANTGLFNANVSSSDYQGAFFGGNAAEVAGTFQFDAQNVPAPGGGTQRIEAVGGFGGQR